jgi:hypothetical protein
LGWGKIGLFVRDVVYEENGLMLTSIQEKLSEAIGIAWYCKKSISQACHIW